MKGPWIFLDLPVPPNQQRSTQKGLFGLVTMHSLGPGGWERLTEISLACYMFESSVELCVFNSTLKSPFSWSLSKAQDRGAKAFGEGCVCERGSWQYPKLKLNPKYTGLVPTVCSSFQKKAAAVSTRDVLDRRCPSPLEESLTALDF